MREIKFRAWILEYAVLVDVEMIDFKEKYIAHEDLSFTFSDQLEPSEPVCVTEFKDCVLMQYTGLKDNNGKEIYEGDIIYVVDPEPNSEDVKHPEFKDVISFEEGSFIFKNEEMIVGTFSQDALSVGGNIYENEELIGEEE